MPPEVSVVTCAYNVALYIAEAIESIRAQTFSNFELIVIDDGSTDGTAEIVAEIARREPRMRVVSRGNTGVSRARNEGVELAKAPLIAWQDGDDIAEPNRLEVHVEFMRRHAEVAAAGGAMKWIDVAGRTFELIAVPLSHEEIVADLLEGRGGSLPQPAGMFRRDAILRAGGYREGLDLGEDVDLCLRMAEAGKLANVPEVVLRYRLRPGSYTTSRDNPRQAKLDSVLNEHRIKHGLSPREREAQGVPAPALAGWRYDAFVGERAYNNAMIETARAHAMRLVGSRPWGFGTWKLLAKSILGPGLVARMKMKSPDVGAPGAAYRNVNE